MSKVRPGFEDAVGTGVHKQPESNNIFNTVKEVITRVKSWEQPISGREFTFKFKTDIIYYVFNPDRTKIESIDHLKWMLENWNTFETTNHKAKRDFGSMHLVNYKSQSKGIYKK